MSEVSHKSHKAGYFKVFGLLTALTVIELIIPDMNVSKFAKFTSLTGLAIGKAALVGWFYMHLNEESKWMRFIALIPISAFIYALVVVLESMYR